LMAGDVVCLDPSLRAGVKKCANQYDKTAVGVITTTPGLVIGDIEDRDVKAAPVVLAGRTPVKVSTENGPIKAGDLLTASSIPGVAMKADKAGQIIGQAMAPFNSEDIGMTMVFVKTNFSHGSSDDFFDNVGDENITFNKSDFSRQALSYLTTEYTPITPETNLSEIVTDRVIAGLEIISPKVTTDALATNSIEAGTGSNINLKLGPDGQFLVTDAAGKRTMTFDSLGNATFTGTLTADKIKANQIEGLELFVNNISAIPTSQAAVSAEPENNSVATPSTEQTPEADSIDKLRVATATVTLKLNVDGSLNVDGGLTVDGPSEFNGESIFNKLATFIDKVIFRKDVEFTGTPTFNSDTAGFATITENQKEVEVKFDKPYESLPVVTLTVKNGRFVQYAYKDLTKTGFTIVLSEPATNQVDIAWTALSVRNSNTTKSAPAAVAPESQAELLTAP